MTPVVFRVKQLREEKGWTQQQLAEKSGARQATISDMENGKARRVDLAVLEGLSDALECEVGELMVIERDKKRGQKA